MIPSPLSNLQELKSSRILGSIFRAHMPKILLFRFHIISELIYLRIFWTGNSDGIACVLSVNSHIKFPAQVLVSVSLTIEYITPEAVLRNLKTGWSHSSWGRKLRRHFLYQLVDQLNWCWQLLALNFSDKSSRKQSGVTFELFCAQISPRFSRPEILMAFPFDQSETPKALPKGLLYLGNSGGSAFCL